MKRFLALAVLIAIQDPAYQPKELGRAPEKTKLTGTWFGPGNEAVAVQFVGEEKQPRIAFDTWTSPCFDEILDVAISPNLKHIAVVGRDGKKDLLVTDDRTFTLPEGKRFWMAFSPDSKRIAVGLHKMQNQSVPAEFSIWIDGKAGEAYSWIEGPVWNPDNSGVFYRAERGADVHIVRGAEADGPFTDARLLGFGADGNVAYAASKLGKWKILMGLKRTSLPDISADRPAFTADGKHWAAFVKNSDGARQLMLDGTPVGVARAGTVNDLVLSADGSTAVHQLWSEADMEKKLRTSVCVNGVPVNDRKYGMIRHLSISADGKTVAFAGETMAAITQAPRWKVVVNGKETPEFEAIDRIVMGPEVFYISREKVDSLQRLAWFNGANKPWVAARQFLRVVPSPNGQHVAYSCIKPVNGKDLACVEVDSQVQLPTVVPEFDWSPDGKWLRYHVIKDGVVSRAVKELSLK